MDGLNEMHEKECTGPVILQHEPARAPRRNWGQAFGYETNKQQYSRLLTNAIDAVVGLAGLALVLYAFYSIATGA